MKVAEIPNDTIPHEGLVQRLFVVIDGPNPADMAAFHNVRDPETGVRLPTLWSRHPDRRELAVVGFGYVPITADTPRVNLPEGEGFIVRVEYDVLNPESIPKRMN